MFMELIGRPRRALRRIARAIGALAGSEEGAAATEFAISFPVLLLLILGTMQMALLYTAKLVVDYAAFTAARTAVVTIPEELPGERPGCLGDDVAASDKLRRIKLAAVLPIAGVSPPLDTYVSYVGSTFASNLAGLLADLPAILGPGVTTTSLLPTSEDAALSVDRALDARSIGGSSGAFDRLARLGAKIPYAYFATGVTVTSPSASGCEAPGSRSFARLDDVTVEVSHVFFCAIPIASRVVGRRLAELSAEERELLARAIAGSSLALTDLPLLPGRYVVIRSRTTLPAEGL